VWIPCLIAVAFAMVKVNDLSLSRMLLLMIERTEKPPRRVWAPRTGLTIHIRTIMQESEKAEKEKEAKHQRALQEEKKRSKIDELSTILDSPLEKTHDTAPSATPSPSTATTEVVHEDEPAAPRLPVDPNRISVDEPPATENHPQDDGLSAYRGVFRDIHP
jgi:hypothetical protein